MKIGNDLQKTQNYTSIELENQNNFKNKTDTQNTSSHNNGYSSINTKQTNNDIGILQSANAAIKAILSNPNIELDEAISIISSAYLFGKPVFRYDNVIKDTNGNVLFNANRILEIIPEDNSDIYTFKKRLKHESELISNALMTFRDNLSNDQTVNTGKANDIDIDYTDFDSSYVLNNNLFSKAHNTNTLASRIDTLLG